MMAAFICRYDDGSLLQIYQHPLVVSSSSVVDTGVYLPSTLITPPTIIYIILYRMIPNSSCMHMTSSSWHFTVILPLSSTNN